MRCDGDNWLVTGTFVVMIFALVMVIVSVTRFFSHASCFDHVLTVLLDNGGVEPGVMLSCRELHAEADPHCSQDY